MANLQSVEEEIGAVRKELESSLSELKLMRQAVTLILTLKLGASGITAIATGIEASQPHVELPPECDTLRVGQTAVYLLHR